MNSDPSAKTANPVPLLYGGSADPADDTPLVTPSEEAMSRHLAAQLAAVEAARRQQPPQRPAAARRLAVADVGAPAVAGRGDVHTISPELATELAAKLDAISPSLAQVAARPNRQAPAKDSGQARAAVPPATEEPASMPMNPGSRRGGAATAPGPAETPLQHIGRHRVLARLKRSATAPAYRVLDPQNGQERVLQFLVSSRCEDDVQRGHLLAGGRLAARLSHPNILPIHEVDEFEQRPYLLTDRIDGPTLAQRLEDQPRLPVDETLALALPLARALACAHEAGVVHRDLQARHVILHAEPAGLQLTGFGLVQATGGAAALALPPTWPEQIRGEALDSRVDQFSFGALLYEMLAGQKPFFGDTPAALALRISQEEPPSLIKIRPDVPAGLRRLVERCLAKQPGQRYASAQDLVQALLHVQAEVEASARQQARPRRWPLRLQAAAAMGLATALVLGPAASWVAQQQEDAALAQAGAQGRAWAGTVAAQMAAHVLAEEWPSVEQQAQEVLATGSLASLQVVDAAGAVRVSSQAGQAGQPFLAVGEPVAGLGQAGAAVRRISQGPAPVWVFDVPVLYQGKPLGRLVLGLSEAPLVQQARLTWGLLLGLAGLGALAAALAAYVLAGWASRPLRAAAAGLAEIGKGRWGHRLGGSRSEEIAELHESFDAMAQALQRLQANRDNISRK